MHLIDSLFIDLTCCVVSSSSYNCTVGAYIYPSMRHKFGLAFSGKMAIWFQFSLIFTATLVVDFSSPHIAVAVLSGAVVWARATTYHNILTSHYYTAVLYVFM